MTGWERAELMAMRALLEAGYSVHRAMPFYQRVGKETHLVGNDFWGLFDLLAVSAANLRFVQVKAGRTYRGPEKAWREKLATLARPASVFAEWWYLTDTGLWRITRFDHTGRIVPVLGEVAS